MTDGDVGELARSYLTEQCTVIIDAHAGLRVREPIIHPTRVAVRRLRSTLRTYQPLFDSERSAVLEAELVWWAGLLGAVRDLDVLQPRLEAQLAELPPELVVGPIERQLQTELEVGRQAGWQQLIAELDGDRYRELIADLRRWRKNTPLTDKAAAPVKKVGRYLKRANRKLDRRLARAMTAYEAGDPGADELFHSARKAGKRARYAAELVLPLWGEKAEQLIAERKALQDVLGEHQDSIVSAAFLRDQGIRTGIRSGHNGFTYGLLYARELARGASIGNELRRFLS